MAYLRVAEHRAGRTGHDGYGQLVQAAAAAGCAALRCAGGAGLLLLAVLLPDAGRRHRRCLRANGRGRSPGRTQRLQGQQGISSAAADMSSTRNDTSSQHRQACT